jgi:2-isopropylmalate synthase
MKTEIYDTTLRDGSQQEGISLTVEDKLRIASLLDELGVDFVEGGWPGANPKDDEFFRRAQGELDLGTATLVAFGSTRRPRATVANDSQLQALLAADTEVICIVGKSWDYHVREALRVDLDEGVRMVAESIEYLRDHDRRVFFDAEHFFDGFRSNPEFALRVLQAATEAGAERLVLCDTNGGTLPTPILHAIESVQQALPESPLGVHFHDDVGCAVASSVMAIDAGVQQVQGCINGYGERTGNADLSTLIPDLALKMSLAVLPEGRLELLGTVAHHIAEVVNIALDPHHPYVGVSAFTHKAGLHTSALARRPDAYEHENPSEVGNHTRMVVSELAGRASVLAEAKRLGLDVDAETATQILQQVKDLEHHGYHFEAADGSFELLMRRALGWEQDFFELESFRVFTDRRAREEIVAEAVVKVVVQGRRVVTTGEGVGPVHALDQALRSALRTAYPDLDRLRLTDYRVRVLDSSYGTEATVRVLLETSDGDETWGTIGVHENVIEASWDALADGLIVGLLRMQG